MKEACELIDSYRHFQLLRAALELGLFEWLLEQGPATQGRIAERMRLNPGRLPSFLLQLVAHGWLLFDGACYTASTKACQLLGRDGLSVSSGGKVLGVGHPLSCWSRLSELLLTLDDCPAGQAEWPLARSAAAAVAGPLPSVAKIWS